MIHQVWCLSEAGENNLGLACTGDGLLTPGHERIDELADFVEWMANAKPEDEQAIRAEIKRYFEDVGDHGSADALNSALTVLLRPDLSKDDRQKILNYLDVFTRADPAEYVQNRGWGTAAALLAGGVPPVAAGETGAADAAAGEGAASEGAAGEAQTAEVQHPERLPRPGKFEIDIPTTPSI